MRRSRLFILADRIAGGNLAEQLTTWRAEGLSLIAISFRLHDEHSVDVSHETIRRWLDEYCPIADDDKVAS